MNRPSVLIAGFLGPLLAIGCSQDRMSTPEIKSDRAHAVASSTTTHVDRPLISDTKPQKSPTEIALSTFLWEGHQMPSTSAEMASKYGKPLSTKVTDPAASAGTPEEKQWAADVYNGGVYKTVKYPGFEATFYDNGGRLDSVTISGGTYPVMWGLGIGASKESIVQRLGKPTDETTELLHYIVLNDGDQTGEVSFKLLNGKASQISWQIFTE